MKTGVSISRRDHAWYVRVTFVTLVALLPLALLAQGSGQSAQPTRSQPPLRAGPTGLTRSSTRRLCHAAG